MLREHLGAAVRGTRRKATHIPLSDWLVAVLLTLLLLGCLVSGAKELHLQSQSREALAQVKSARLAARIVSARCYAAGQPFADFTAEDGLCDGLQEDICELGGLQGTVRLIRTDANGYDIGCLVYQRGDLLAVYDAEDGFAVYCAAQRLYYPLQEDTHAAVS